MLNEIDTDGSIMQAVPFPIRSADNKDIKKRAFSSQKMDVRVTEVLIFCHHHHHSSTPLNYVLAVLTLQYLHCVNAQKILCILHDFPRSIPGFRAVVLHNKHKDLFQV